MLFAVAAWGQAPSYTSASIVNASNFTAAPFAPNSVVALFGTNLAFGTVQLTSDLMVGAELPTQMGGVAVYMDQSLAPLLYVSPTQINFLVPSSEIAGTAQVTVVRQGLYGPTVPINLVSAAPQLFSDASGFAIAQDWNNGGAAISQNAPAQPGDLLILYATGLGAVTPRTLPGELVQIPSPIVDPSSLQVLINGVGLNASSVLYAGLSPGSAGLYQINLVLPGNVGSNPSIQLSMGGQSSASSQLAVQ